jgi:hypothetical protein
LRSIWSFLLFVFGAIFYFILLLLLRSILIILLAMSRSKSSVPCSCPVNTIERKNHCQPHIDPIDRSAI